MVIVWTMIICERIGMWASELPAKRCICCNYICFLNKLLETREWWSTFTFSNCGTETSLVLMDKIRPTSWHSKCYTCPYLSHSLQWCEGLSINNSKWITNNHQRLASWDFSKSWSVQEIWDLSSSSLGQSLRSLGFDNETPLHNRPSSYAVTSQWLNSKPLLCASWTKFP